jgi:hypothetical protein
VGIFWNLGTKVEHEDRNDEYTEVLETEFDEDAEL